MDAFLKPSVGTDTTGQPLQLKTIEFYKGLREQLTPDGIVVINLNIHSGTSEDIATIRAAYPQIYAFKATTPNDDCRRHVGEEPQHHRGRPPRPRPRPRPALQGDIPIHERAGDVGEVSRRL